MIIRHCASSAPAIAAAAKSAFTFKPPLKLSSIAIGEITGTWPPFRAFLMACGFTAVMTPTKPKSAGVPSTNLRSGSAIKDSLVRPDSATALTPAFCSDLATAGPTSSASTRSTTSKISGVVTRNPPINSEVISSAFSAASICGPPP